MLIGHRLRSIRKTKTLSQGDIEERTGLKRCYVSRVECGRTVPSVETLRKWAAALQVPVYALFYDGEKPSHSPALKRQAIADRFDWGSSGSQILKFNKLRLHLSKMTERNRMLLLSLANRMVSSKRQDASNAA